MGSKSVCTLLEQSSESAAGQKSEEQEPTGNSARGRVTNSSQSGLGLQSLLSPSWLLTLVMLATPSQDWLGFLSSNRFPVFYCVPKM